jgi:glycosyltransferase involved in cell wall biosynthesis
VIEAMLARKPVIGTPYGGVADFLSPDTGYPLTYKFIELAETIEPYPDGFIWADPDHGSIRQRLREVFENPEKARILAEAGYNRICELFSPFVAGERIASEIRRIWGADGEPIRTSRASNEARVEA